PTETGESEGVTGVGDARVVHHEVVLADLGDLRDLESAPGSRCDTVLALGSETDGFTRRQRNDAFGSLVLVLEYVEGAVVEYGTVLVDLHQRGTPVCRGGGQHLVQSLPVDVQGAPHERGLGPQRQRYWVERRVDRAERCGFGDHTRIAGGRVLTFGQSVDPVVEQQDGEVHV